MSMMAIGITTAVISTGMGAYQMIDANKKQKSAQKKLDELSKNSPLYKEDKSISDYYQQTLNRFLENPTDSARYQLGAMNAKRATAQGISALQDRRSAIGGIGRLAIGQNAAMQNIVGQAEADKAQRLQQLGSATSMKGQDRLRAFDFNKLTPYNRQIGLEELKGQAAGQQFNAGVQMVGQGISAGATAASGYKGKAGGTQAPSGLVDASGNYTGKIGSITG